jgi:NADH-quinone oxidoreductase subunit N
MSVATKAAGFAAFLRVFLYSLSGLKSDWNGLLWALAALTMIAGNVIAISQTNIKRMLAYSSIAHAGYVLVALVAGGPLGNSSALFYLMAYVFMNLGAFGIALLLGRAGEERVEISDYAGLGYKHPILGVLMSIFLLSLGGIPPTAGFVGKLYIFSAAVRSGFVGLAVIGVIASVISVYYYLRVVVMMYMRSPEGEVSPVSLSPGAAVALAVAVAGTLELGLFPGGLLGLAEQSVLALL